MSARRTLFILLVAVATLTASVTPAGAQTAPEFKLGFKTLAELIPGVAGQPLANEQHDSVTGDSMQPTTTGLMVWRKATNTVAFTNGAMTWVIGPLGLQSRPNDTRFAWESSAPSADSLPADAVTPAFVRGPGGAWIARFHVQNPNDRPMQLEINAVALESPGGQPIMDAPTVFVQAVMPGTSRTFTVTVPTTAEVGDWRWWAISRPSSPSGMVSVDVGTTAPLQIDSLLVGALEELRRVEGGDWLARVAAEYEVWIESGPTPSGVLGAYFPEENAMIISSQLNDASAWTRAAVLAHELEHAAGTVSGNVPEDPIQCLRFEADAFRREAEVWAQLWQNNLPVEADDIHAELNNITRTVAHDPETFASHLVQLYGADCGL